METIKNTIKDLLIDSFDPSVLSVINESNMHNVPDGSESHFKIVIVPLFQNLLVVGSGLMVNLSQLTRI